MTAGANAMRGKRVAVIGAGLGGLTAALAFAKAGADVEVFEKAPELTEIGAGIQITPNGARALEALGLGAQMAEFGLAAGAVVPTDGLTGYPITRFDLSTQSPKYRFFHRAALINFIGKAAQAAGAKIYLGAPVTSIAEDGLLRTPQGDFTFDLCVGADGIHSMSRLFVAGASEPKFTGQVAWRAVVSAKGAAPEAHIWMGPGRHIVTYPLQGDVLNIVAVQEREAWAEEGWSHPDDAHNLQAAFADFAPEVQKILSHVKEPKLWGLFRHEVAQRWHSDRIVILGDAAHPTLPFLAQGANLAIEDAYVLARCCDGSGDITSGLRTYEDLRKSRVTRAIDAANANARNYHLDGIARRTAHLGLKTIGKIAPNAFLNRMSWLYDHDVTTEPLG